MYMCSTITFRAKAALIPAVTVKVLVKKLINSLYSICPAPDRRQTPLETAMVVIFTMTKNMI